jgi:hypothetical protein
MRSLLFLCSILIFSITVLAGNGSLFTENKGQWPDRVRFRAGFEQHAVFVEKAGFTVVAWNREHRAESVERSLIRGGHTYRVSFVGADERSFTGVGAVPGVENFILGDDPSKWASGARRYREVAAADLYPGVDLRCLTNDAFKYELIVHPGAATSAIELLYEGQDRIELVDGALYIHTSIGILVEQPPVAYQEHDGVRIPVTCSYALEGSRVRYVLADGYDPTQALVIDPSLVFSTFSGSTADNFGFGATHDASGHLYASGVAFGTGYPTTLGAYQTDSIGGTEDIVLTKFALDGSSLLWSTYFGGTASECPLAMAVNADDELFLLSLTGSSDHPTTPGAYDQTFHGGPSLNFTGTGFSFPNGCDLGLAHLSADGSSLIAGTYLGGTGTDGANSTSPLTHNYGDSFRAGLVLDANGDLVVATLHHQHRSARGERPTDRERRRTGRLCLSHERRPGRPDLGHLFRWQW